MAQFLRIKTHRYLLVLLAEYLHLAHAPDTAKAVFERVHIVAKFAIGLFVALHSYKQGRGIAEAAERFHTENTCRKLQLHILHTDFELIPERRSVIHVFVKLNENNKGACRYLAVRLCLVDLLIREYILFDGFQNLFLYLLDSSAGIDCSHHALADSKFGKFVLVHHLQRVHAECNQHRGKEYYFLAVFYAHSHYRRRLGQGPGIVLSGCHSCGVLFVFNNSTYRCAAAYLVHTGHDYAVAR